MGNRLNLIDVRQYNSLCCQSSQATCSSHSRPWVIVKWTYDRSCQIQCSSPLLSQDYASNATKLPRVKMFIKTHLQTPRSLYRTFWLTCKKMPSLPAGSKVYFVYIIKDKERQNSGVDYNFHNTGQQAPLPDSQDYQVLTYILLSRSGKILH